MRKLAVERAEGPNSSYRVLIDGEPTVVQWSMQAAADLLVYHQINIEAELIHAVLEVLKPYNLSEEERLELVHLLTSTFKETS